MFDRLQRMVVLDTNVVSELVRTTPSPVVIGWVDALDSADLVITALSGWVRQDHHPQRVGRRDPTTRTADARGLVVA